MNELPNQQSTWKALCGDIETFESFLVRAGNGLAGNRDSQIFQYLVDQLRGHGLNVMATHPIIGLFNHFSENDPRGGELAYAYLAYVHGDPLPGRKLVAGYRLSPNLHPDYIATTRCYG